MNRRSFLTGLIAAPVVIRTAGLLMPIKPLILPEANVGDVIFDRELGGPYSGWVCTASGTPGTWEAFGEVVAAPLREWSQPPLGARRDASYRRVDDDRSTRRIRFA